MPENSIVWRVVLENRSYRIPELIFRAIYLPFSPITGTSCLPQPLSCAREAQGFPGISDAWLPTHNCDNVPGL